MAGGAVGGEEGTNGLGEAAVELGVSRRGGAQCGDPN
jgi:hypothetical protein